MVKLMVSLALASTVEITAMSPLHCFIIVLKLFFMFFFWMMHD